MSRKIPRETYEDNRNTPKAQITSSKTDLQDVMKQDISLDDIIKSLNEIKWVEIWWWKAEVTDGDGRKVIWIMNSNYEKIDEVIFILKHFFSTEDWLKQFEEYIKTNEKHAQVNTMWNIDILWLIRKASAESLWITDEQYNELVKLLEKNSSGR